jgi:phospholipid/cholesterol/gamma-HCH transport system substrate-binding protein
MTEEDRVRVRHTDRWVGLLVLVAVALFLAALLQRGALREWFARDATLTVLLPEEGVAGLAVGADAEVMGIRAGNVRDIMVEPNQRIRAELRVEEQAKVFIRSDSTAVIRKRFGVAGAAYLDIQRGTGPPLNWDHAVIEATSERAPTETVGALLDEAQKRIFPVLEQLERGISAFSATAQRLERGEGTVGRLLADDTLARQAEEAGRQLNEILVPLQSTVQEVQRLVATISGATNGNGAAAARNGAGPPPGSLPSILRRTDQTLASLERASRDVARATPALPRAARNVEEGTDSLPALLVQTQETARSLETLMTQLRGHWLLRGSTTAPPTTTPREALRPSAERVRP